MWRRKKGVLGLDLVLEVLFYLNLKRKIEKYVKCGRDRESRRKYNI
jgi:hypothetical protein